MQRDHRQSTDEVNHSAILTRINIGPYQITMASVDPAGMSPNRNFSFGKENLRSSAAEMEKG